MFTSAKSLFSLLLASAIFTGLSVPSFAMGPLPVCEDAYPSSNTLWPANHKFASVSIKGLGDSSIAIQCITQDEPLNTSGDGNTEFDGDGVGTSQALVRAERIGGGNGRVYHIDFLATNDFGQCYGQVNVGVPPSKKKAVTDDGRLYVSVANPTQCDGEPVNRPPAFTTSPIEQARIGVPYVYNVGATDPDGDLVSFTLSHAPAGMTINSLTGVINWMPSVQQTCGRPLEIIATDSNGGSSVQSFSIEVLPAENQAPVIQSEPITQGSVDHLYQYSVLATDADGDTLQYSFVQAPAGLSISAAGEITWIPELGQQGDHPILLAVEDGNGGRAEQAFTLRIALINNPPVITSIPAPQALVGQLYQYAVEANDPDGDSLSYSLNQAPTGMGIDAVSGQLSWTPIAGQVGEYSVEVLVQDGRTGSVAQSFTLHVVAPNHNPVINSVPTLSANVGQPYIYNVEASDSDADLLSYSLSAAPSGASIDAQTGHINWLPSSLQLGENSFLIIVTDGQGGSASQSFNVLVIQPNRAPVITSTPILSVNENETYLYAVNANDPDEGDVLTYRLTSAPQNMIIDSATGVLQWLPTTADIGAHSVVVEVVDQQNLTGAQSFSLQVLDVNYPPVATSLDITTLEDVPVEIALQGTDQDGDELSYEVIRAVTSGSLIGSAPSLVYQPAQDFNGTAQFEYKVTDLGGLSSIAMVNIAIAAVNDAPTIVSSPPLTASEGITYTYQLLAEDSDSAELSFELVTSPVGMTISETGLVVWLSDYTQAGENSVVISVSDGVESASQTFALTVLNVNRAPEAHSANVTLNEDSTAAITLGGSDADGDNLSFTLINQPAHGVLAGTAPYLSYTPSLDYHGEDAFTFTTHDGSEVSSAATVFITINSINDTPQWQYNPQITAQENVGYSATVHAVDADNDTLVYHLTTAPEGMNLNSSSGDLYWVPNFDQAGGHSITVTADDSRGGLASSSFMINVANTNRAPTIDSSAGLDAESSQPYYYNVKASDPDGDALRYDLSSTITSLSIDPVTGTIAWTPTAIEIGSHSVTVTATDLAGLSDSQTFTLVVAAGNSAPLITSSAVLFANQGTQYVYQIVASDVDGDAITYAMIAAPEGASFDSTTGTVAWQTTGIALGDYSFSLTATDSKGATTTQSFTVALLPVNQRQTHEGTEFWIPVSVNHTVTVGGTFDINLLSSSVDTEVTISIPALEIFGETINLNAGEMGTYSISTDEYLAAGGLGLNELLVNSAIHIESPTPITAYFLNQKTSTTDGFLGLPVESLGKEYIAATYIMIGKIGILKTVDAGQPGPIVTIVATEDSTHVTIDPIMDILPGDQRQHEVGSPILLTMNRGDVYNLETKGSFKADLTGSMIRANKPIAVFGQQDCANIPTSASACDHIVEQLPAIESLGTEYLTAPFRGRAPGDSSSREYGDVHRVIAAYNNTLVIIDGKLHAQLNKGEYYEFFSSAARYIKTSQPSLVVQFGVGDKWDRNAVRELPDDYADPFMVIVPPAEQFLRSYTFNTPARDLAYNFANFLVPTNVIDTFTLDGQPVDSNQFVTIPGSLYSYIQLSVSTGAHTVEAAEPIGAYFYGFDYFESYGYLGGMALSVADAVQSLDFIGDLSQSLDNQWCGEATVGDQYGRPVIGVRVGFTLTGVTNQQAYKFTNEQGVARLCYQAPLSGVDDVTASINGLTENISVNWSAGLQNLPPLITSVPELTALVGEAYRYNVQAIDPEGGALHFALTDAPNGMTIDAETGEIFWSKVDLRFGDHYRETVAIDVTDEAGIRSEQVFVLREYKAFNTAPVWNDASIGLTATQGVPYIYNLNKVATSLAYPKYQVLATDVDEDAIFIDLLQAPAEAYIQRIKAYYTDITRPNDPRSYEGVISYFRWAPEQVGAQTIELGLRDARGGISESRLFTVDVKENQAPYLNQFTPVTVASYNEVYEYVLDINNDVPLASSDNRDNLRIIFEDPTPSQVRTVYINSERYHRRLVITWGGPRVVGEHTIRFRIADSVNVSEPYEYTLTVVNDNKPPMIASSNLPNAEATIPYQYRLSATDPEGGPLTYRLLSGLEGMTLNASTGELNWIPGAHYHSGHETILVEVEDDIGLVDVKWFLIYISAFSNRAPEFVPAYRPKFAKVGQEFVYKATATDREGDIPIAYTLSSSASGSVINGQDGTITWTPTAEGRFWLNAKATDSLGNYNSSNAEFWYVDVLPSSAVLDATIEISPSNIIELGETVTLSVIPENEASSVQVTLTVDGQAVDVDLLLQTEYTPVRVGKIPVIATITDGYETVVRTTNIFVRDPDDLTPPLVEINSPTNTSDITAPTEIFGTAQDDNLVEVILLYKRADEPLGLNLLIEDFIELYRGPETFLNQAIAELDPTMLVNGTYHLLLQATDSNDQTSAAVVAVNVTGDFKVGNFSVTLEDVNVPMAGLPISVSRTYDSRRKSENLDFGYGWSIDYQNVRLEESDEPTKGWTQTLGRASFLIDGSVITASATCIDPSYEKTVTVTLPNGDTEKFAVALKPTNNSLASISDPNCYLIGDRFYHPQFVPAEGTQSSLQTSDGESLYLSELENGYLSDIGAGEAALITRYTLTTRTGYVYALNQDFGVEQITDPNGYTLTFSDAGIVHSDGDSVTFNRDTTGRISSLTLPNGDVVSYQYSSGGDLTSVTDQLLSVSRYTYNNEHGLIEMLDPLNRTLVKNIYNDEGRLIAQEDGEGNRTDFTHNIAGRESVVTDRIGRTTFYYYDDMGNVTAEVDALNQLTSYVYDANGNQLSKTDALGNTTTATFNDADDQLTQTDALGNTVSYSYNSRGQELTITDAAGEVYTNTYDGLGNILTITDPQGNMATVSYIEGANGFPGTVTDVLGFETKSTYTRFGQKGSETNALGHVTTYAYDDNGNQISEIHSRTLADNTVVEEVTSFEYDKRNRLIKTTDAMGNASESEYDILGQVAARIDALGRRTEMDYDLYGRLTATHYPDGTSESKTYDVEGNMLSDTDRNGNITTFEYDALNRQTAVVYANGDREQTEYDAVGRVSAQIDALNNRSEFEYDAAGRRTLTRDALGNEHHFEYDANGNLTAEVDANTHRTEYSYNVLDQRTATTYHNSSVMSDELDAMGRRTGQTDQASITTRYGYDSIGRLISVTDTLNQVTSYTYDEAGNKLTQTDAEGRTSAWTYDALGRVLTHTLPMGQVQSFSYDAVGNMVTRTDFNGDTTAYSYDDQNRLLTITYADGNMEAFTYGSMGNRTQATQTDPLGDVRVTDYAYDIRNRLTSEIQATGHALDYLYDAAGNRSRVTVSLPTLSPTFEITDYTYDALNRLQTVTDNAGNITSYGYDAVGNRASVSYANGSSEVYTYDTLNRLTLKQTYDGTGALVQSYTYTLHTTGRRTQIDDLSGRSTAYGYDDLYRLTSETVTDTFNGNYSAAYQYDAVGNRSYETVDGVQTAYTYDNNDRLTQTGGTTYTHDANGNTLSESLDGVTTTYNYDSLNKLVQVTKAGVVSTYLYNVDGIRTGQDDGVSATSYVVDSNRDYAQVLLETDGTDAVNYVYGDDLVSQTRSAGTFYYHYDGLGSTRALSDAAGTITDEYNYEAFGEVLNKTGTTENDYLFTGEQFDQGLGQYYLRARYYDQGVGRFTQMDTWMGNNSDPVTLHKYLYANADPINYIDPTGNFSLGSLSAGMNIQGILTTASIAGSAFNLYGASTDEDGLTAKEVGLSVLIGLAGPAGGKLVKLLAPKFSKLSNAAKFAYLQKRLFGNLKAVKPRSLNRIQPPVGGITTLTGKTINSLRKNEVYVYVVDNSNKLLVAVRGSSGRSGVKHTQLTGGGSAKAAGELMVVNGKILINNSSGRYRSQAADAVNRVKTLLQGSGNPVDITGPL